MPTYEYRRPDGTTFEVFQKISDDALTHDPETGVPVQRLISGGAGLQFKGDGFYLTDYVRKGNGQKGASDSTSGGSESAGESTSAKAAPKAESSGSSSPPTE